jgi:hypothetical protein
MDWNSIARTERNSLSFRQLVHPGCQNTFSGIASMRWAFASLVSVASAVGRDTSSAVGKPGVDASRNLGDDGNPIVMTFGNGATREQQ